MHEVFVAGLPFNVSEDKVKDFFLSIGKIVEIRMPKNADGSNCGFAHIGFEASAERALGMNGQIFEGSRIYVTAKNEQRTLYLGNLETSWTEKTISTLLAEHSIFCQINMTPSGEKANRGYCILVFPNHFTAKEAMNKLSDPHVKIGTKQAEIAFAKATIVAQVESEQSVSVYVDRIPSEATDDEIREAFLQYGEIESLKHSRTMSTAKRTDFAFVNFKTHSSAIAAVKGHNKIHGVRVGAQMARPTNAHGQPPQQRARKGGRQASHRGGDQNSASAARGNYSRKGESDRYGPSSGQYGPRRSYGPKSSGSSQYGSQAPKTYGPPSGRSYGPPQGRSGQYGAPSASAYGPPQTQSSYGSGTSSYAAGPTSSSYGASTSYGKSDSSSIPQQQSFYGPSQTQYSADSTNYGSSSTAPQQTPQPISGGTTVQYGAPTSYSTQQQAPSSYAPVDPRQQYGAAATGQPTTSYYG
eukprot:TRINITY_DN777876_c0_g1_i1.p1 TRINITY_DN777876_c0_g1~~TRINITY_DN777876_c0_g1_i1.p1  ORF type:complete len:487 (-),score=132.07 TRINITY_DN777876_c0_g1_i1:165-1571(-)